MTPSVSVTVESADRLMLEAMVETPNSPRATLVLCHPHPRMGGTMNAPLLVELGEHLVERGWAVLRFNFRGIGASQGDSSDGLAEVADAQGAVAWVRRSFPGLPVAVAGWSFGAAVAIRAAAADDGLVACAALAPAVHGKEGVTAGLPPAWTLRLAMPVLIVCGANDEQVSPADCRAWAAEVPGATYVELKGANHFFWGKYERVATELVAFLDGALGADPRPIEEVDL